MYYPITEYTQYSITKEEYHWYSSAMAKNHSKYVLPYENMEAHIFNQYTLVHNNGSVLSGELDQESNSLWVSHWCPASMRKGVQFMKDLRVYYDVDIYIGVLPSMAEMLGKLKWYCHGTYMADYPVVQEKTIFSNRRLETVGLLSPTYYEMVANMEGFCDY